MAAQGATWPSIENTRAREVDSAYAVPVLQFALLGYLTKSSVFTLPAVISEG